MVSKLFKRRENTKKVTSKLEERSIPEGGSTSRDESTPKSGGKKVQALGLRKCVEPQNTSQAIE